MIEPYWYQADCLKAIARARKQGRERILYTMASGLGKTITSALDVFGYRKENPDARTLFLCHQNRILDHARSEFEAIHGSKHSYGFYTGEEKTQHDTQFLFASFQTMRKHCRRFRPDAYDVVYVDESHHTWAETFLDVADYWKPKTMVGMTATPDRTDGQNIRHFFGKEVFSLPLDDALVYDILTPIDYRMLTDEIQLKKIIDTPGGKLSIKKLNRSIFVPRRDEEIAKIINTHADKIENPRIIIFCESIAHCDHLAKYLHGSMPYHSKISLTERMVRLEMFRQGMIRALITRDVFNEGIDIPEANVIVFLRSTKSPLIFFQQLGRGLRKSDGKDKVTVLDFVANCERIKQIVDLWEVTENKRKELLERPAYAYGDKGDSSRSVADHEPLMLNVNSVDFRETIMPILDIIRHSKKDFYPTWQEAGKAVLRLNITSQDAYRENYKLDNRLHSHPDTHYKKDWPGWSPFFGKPQPDFYRTWQEASSSAIKLGIKTKVEYADKYADDPRLPSSPSYAYSDFPKWRVFLGGKDRNFYSYKKSSRIVQKMGITTNPQYQERKHEDERLPGDPPSVYKDVWQGWPIFLGEEPREMCRTWRIAARISREAGIETKEDYLLLCDKDNRLPRDPWTAFKDFPGWPTFFKRKNRNFKNNPYKTWQEAAQSARKLGATTAVLYQALRNNDPRLYADPIRVYKDCPDWNTFLGK